MSLLSSCKGLKHPSEAAEMADVDVTPIMNMFIILIPFLVSMAVFTHLSILPFSVPSDTGSAASASEDEDPRLRLTIVLSTDYLKLAHGEMLLDSIHVLDSGHDFDRLGLVLSAKMADYDDGEVVIAVRDNVKIQNVVKVMDICKINNFEKVGISSATANPTAGI
ncbi:hypothetical protein CHISP_1872 [Chitinispirillum alkaliphilum]|nr:hypothetical protein CHISP_1872 [Chitinispirillum alkaliphilum]